MFFVCVSFLCLVAIASGGETGRIDADFADDFSGRALDPAKWSITRKGDFRESTLDVYGTQGNQTPRDYRLRLRANTMGTSDDTVKFHGVRSLNNFDFSKGREISFDVDWNNQSNGSYLTAAIYIVPTVTAANPSEEKDWLKFEYVGVPPGRNARAVVAVRTNGNTKYLYTENWPAQKEGRYISYQKLKIVLSAERLRIAENGKEIFSTDSHGLNFTSGYLYLQMSSHSNYPAREIYFDNIKVSRVLETNN